MKYILIWVILLLFSCNKTTTFEENIYDSNGNMIEKYQVVKFSDKIKRKNGLYNRYFENGQVAENGYYRNDLKDSIWINFDKNGRKLSEEQWNNGIRNGVHIKWNEKGDTTEFGTFVEGKKTGLWGLDYHWKNGRKIGSFIDDQKNGIWTEYYLTKRPIACCAQGNYKEDKKDGVWLEVCRNRYTRRFSHVVTYYKDGETVNSEKELNIEEYSEEFKKLESNWWSIHPKGN